MNKSSWKTRILATAVLFVFIGLLAYTLLHGITMNHYDPESTLAFHWLFGLGFLAGGICSIRALIRGS